VSAVIRPPRELWDCEQLLERAVPGFSLSSAASIHASGASRGRRAGQSRAYLHSAPAYHSPTLRPPSASQVDVVMEIDMEGDLSPGKDLSQASPGDRRDEVHRQMVYELGQHLRSLTGQAASLQQHRRANESRYSPANAKFAESLPSESDWSRTWTLRESLKFVAKIPPPRSRSWTFGESEASSLADFLGLPGEKGARPGREWAKHDWGRELMVVKRLAEDFEFGDLNHGQMAEYEYEVMSVFAVD